MKRYLDEDGSDAVDNALDADTNWCTSAITLTEAQITLCNSSLNERDRRTAVAGLQSDWERMIVVPVDERCLSRAWEIGCLHGVRTLNAIHLAAAERVPAWSVYLTFDRHQARAAAALGLRISEWGTN